MKKLLIKGVVVFALVASLLVGEATVAQAAVAQSPSQAEYPNPNGLFGQLEESLDAALAGFQHAIDSSNLPPEQKSFVDSLVNYQNTTIDQIFGSFFGLFGG